MACKGSSEMRVQDSLQLEETSSGWGGGGKERKEILLEIIDDPQYDIATHAACKIAQNDSPSLFSELSLCMFTPSLVENAPFG